MEKKRFASVEEEREFVTAHRGKRQLRANEYIGEDGYAHCTVCGERTESIQPWFGYGGLTYALVCGDFCACKRAEQEAAAKRREREKLEDRRNIAFGESYRWKKCSFGADDGSNPALTACVKRFVDRTIAYLNTPKDDRTDCRGLLLFGDTGRGKTFMTAAACNALCESGFTPYMREVPTIVEDMRAYGDRVVLDGLCRHPVWFFDDFGAERQTEWMQEKVYQLISTAVNRDIVLCVNTNLRREELVSPATSQQRRIYSRLFEKCEMVHVQLQKGDRRLLQAAQWRDMV